MIQVNHIEICSNVPVANDDEYMSYINEISGIDFSMFPNRKFDTSGNDPKQSQIIAGAEDIDEESHETSVQTNKIVIDSNIEGSLHIHADFSEEYTDEFQAIFASIVEITGELRSGYMTIDGGIKQPFEEIIQQWDLPLTSSSKYKVGGIQVLQDNRLFTFQDDNVFHEADDESVTIRIVKTEDLTLTNENAGNFVEEELSSIRSILRVEESHS